MIGLVKSYYKLFIILLYMTFVKDVQKFVLTDEQCKMIEEEAAKSMGSIEHIAGMLGICRKTFYNIYDRDERVSTHYARGKAKRMNRITTVLADIAEGNIKGDSAQVAAISFAMQRCGGYNDKVEEKQQIVINNVIDKIPTQEETLAKKADILAQDALNVKYAKELEDLRKEYS